MRFAQLLLLCATSLVAADWLSEGGDPDQNRWQKHESALNTGTVKDLKLLWRLPLAESLSKDSYLKSPVILGPIFTHRGVKELVFITSTSGSMFAVDADLGRIFWTRRFPESPPDDRVGANCTPGNASAPAIAAETIPSTEDGEPHSPLRPVYVVTGDGLLRQISPATGEDLAPPQHFLASPAHPFGLVVTREKVTVHEEATCGAQAGVWTRTKLSRQFERDASPNLSANNEARWVDAAGTKWLYSAVSEPSGVLIATQNGKPAWRSTQLRDPRSPIIANGVVYALDRVNAAGHAELFAFDAITGAVLYHSGNAVPAGAASGMAMANGHICFAGGDQALYCFGPPLEI